MKLLRTYIKENIGTSLLGAIFLTLNTFATLAIPFQISNMINHGIIKKNIDMVYSTSIKMITILIFGTVTGIIANHYIALFAARFAKQNRKMLMRNIETLTLDQVSDFGVASLVTRIANDNNNAQQLIVAFFQMILPSPIMAIISIFLTVQLSPSLALIPLFTILIFACAITLTLFKSLPYILKVQKKLDRMVLVLRERFIGAKIIRAFDNSKKERDKFNDIAQDYTDNYITINKKFALLSPMAFSLMSVIITLIIFFGARKVLNNTLEIGSITAIVEYSLTTIAALIMSSMVLVQMPKAVVSIDRIEEILDVTNEIKDKEGLKDNSYYEDILKQNPISLTFDNVCFRYKGAEKQILKNISFSIKAGEIFAIVGATGAGKTTLINLLIRFYDVNGGRILFDGIDISKVSRKELRANFGMVLQDTWLFNGTIAENIAYGKPNATHEEIIEAAKLAKCDSFIRKLPQGYDTIITSENGMVSQGEQQLLTIARTILPNPKVMILDEATSSIDTKTEKDIQAVISELMKGRTSFVIAHRLSTIRNADLILVMKNGDIVEQGNHDELLKVNGIYANLYNTQFNQ